MKLSKVFSLIFAGLGGILMVAAVAVCLVGSAAGTQAGSVPQAARDCTQNLMEALAGGDYRSAQSLLYGQPDLEMDSAQGTEMAKSLGEALRGSVGYAFSGECYLAGTEICREVTVTAMDIPGTLAALPALSREILSRSMEAAGETEDGADTTYTPDIDAVLGEALRQALSNPVTKEYPVVLKLTQQGDVWQVIPDRALLTALSGGLA